MKATNNKKNSLFRAVCYRLLAFLCLTPLMEAKAQLSPDTAWILEDGGTYEVTSSYSFKKLYAVYNATSDGVLILTYNGADSWALYTDATCETIAEVQPEWQGSYSPRVEVLTVKAGETYYFHCSFAMNTGTIEVTFGAVAAPLSLKNVTPSSEKLLNASNGQISVEFSKPVTYGAATLSLGDNVEALVGNGMLGTVSFDVKNVMMQWYRNGVLKAGDEVVLTINDVCAAANVEELYEENGTFTHTFVVAAKPAEIISELNTPSSVEQPMTTFLSYYMTDTQVSLNFDAPLLVDDNNTPSASLTFGDMESEYFYTEVLDIDMSGAAQGVISVELSGKLRRMVDMIPNYMDLEEETRPTSIVLTIENIRGEDGAYAYAAGNGALGSYHFEYTYKELKNDIVSDFTPAIGAKFENVKSIELYIRGEKNLQYDGVSFIYVKGGEEVTEVVPMSEITREADFFDTEAMILTIPVPEIVPDAGTVVSVTLADLKSTDGLDYSADLTATYVVTADGIRQVMNEGEPTVTVYSMSGVRLMKNADKTALGKLRRGIYIINGEKTLLR